MNSQQPKFLEFNGITLSTTGGLDTDLVSIVLFAQGLTEVPPADVDVWLRKGRNEPFFKGHSDQAAVYLKGLLAAPATKNNPYFEDDNGRLVLVVDGKQFNPVVNLRGAMFAVVSFFGWKPGKISWLMNQLGSSNGHKKVETIPAISTETTEVIAE